MPKYPFRFRFSCKNCNSILNGEYMGKDGVPYCEKCYQKLFGVKCAYCNRYISGKVLQAGDNHHFHPTCARCTKCGDPFGDGEEMYLQGSAGKSINELNIYYLLKKNLNITQSIVHINNSVASALWSLSIERAWRNIEWQRIAGWKCT